MWTVYFQLHLLYLSFILYLIFIRYSLSYLLSALISLFFFFFFNDPATPEISPLSLPDALPIYGFQIDCGRFAFLSLFDLVGDLLILVEIAEAGAFHRRDVHEHVLGLVRARLGGGTRRPRQS